MKKLILLILLFPFWLFAQNYGGTTTDFTKVDESRLSVGNSDSLGHEPPSYYIDTATAQNIHGLKTFENLTTFNDGISTDTANFTDAIILKTDTVDGILDASVQTGNIGGAVIHPYTINQEVLATNRIIITDASNADTASIYDDGDTLRLESENPIKIAENFTVKNDGSTIQDSLITKCECSNVADDGTIVLPDATTQSLTVWIDGDDEWALVVIQADGTVTLPAVVGDVVNTDTDTNLCIFDSGTGATIRNRLGASKTVCYTTKYKQ